MSFIDGITYTIDESNRFETFSYANPDHRKKVREIAEHTARQIAGEAQQAFLHFESLKRLLDREEPDYAR